MCHRGSRQLSGEAENQQETDLSLGSDMGSKGTSVSPKSIKQEDPSARAREYLDNSRGKSTSGQEEEQQLKREQGVKTMVSLYNGETCQPVSDGKYPGKEVKKKDCQC